MNLLRPYTGQNGLIRLGSPHDGGYLVPDDLDGISACFSPGVGHEWSFDLALAQEHCIPVYMADGSVEPKLNHPLLHHEPLFIGSQTSSSHRSLDDWIASKDATIGDGDLMLQMDIEGAEYDVLTNVARATLSRFRIMVIEFHGLQHLQHAIARRLIGHIFAKLTQDHAVVHLHPNNYGSVVQFRSVALPRVLEVTLLRRDRLGPCRPTKSFPHPLDAPNGPDKPDVALPDLFYQAFA